MEERLEIEEGDQILKGCLDGQVEEAVGHWEIEESDGGRDGEGEFAGWA